MSQPPTDPPEHTGRPAPSGDQPTYGQHGYGQPTYGQPTYGESTSGEPPQQYGQPPDQPYGQQSGWSQPSAAQYGTDIRQAEAGYAQLYGVKRSTGMATAAMVLGIIAIVIFLFPIGSYVAVVLAIIALVLGIIAVRRPVGKGRAVAGLVLGAIALVGGAIMSVIWTIGFMAASECFDETGSTAGPAFEACLERKATGG